MSYVYVFGVPGDNLVKVGHSRSPKLRRGCLRSKFRMPHGMMLFSTLCGGGTRAMRVERAAHALLCSLRIEGEWFLADLATARAAVMSAAASTP